jgi:hypothetical protein
VYVNCSYSETPETLARVRCQILDIAPRKFEKCLKKFDADNVTEKDYESSGGKFIYNIEIYTFDDKGKEFMPDMDP